MNKAQLYSIVCVPLCVTHSKPSWRYVPTSSLGHFVERLSYVSEQELAFLQWVNCRLVASSPELYTMKALENRTKSVKRHHILQKNI